jgi:carbon monoxide dehydrogenase subunit G
VISAQREILVRSGGAQVWEFVQRIGNWATLVPFYMSHEELGSDESVWRLNVQMGPFSRPVLVHVHVSQWLPGEGADFTIKAPYEPFHGEGAIRLEAGPIGTRVWLNFGTVVTGSMSKVITAMAIPVLKKVADEFSANLLRALGGPPDAPALAAGPQRGAEIAAPSDHAAPLPMRVRRWCRAFLQRLAAYRA